MPKIVNIAGQRFGRLVALEFIAGGKHPKWRCICDCGKTALAPSSALRHGNTRSCGCLHATVLADATRTHGASRTRLYAAWSHLKARCRNPASADFPRYGGRGIEVCDAWLNSFENFATDMGQPPSLKHTLDRIDNNGPYAPHNCRWAVRRVQNNNTRRNVLVTYKGKTRTISEWSNQLSLPYIGLAHRIRRGWPVSEAFERPFRGKDSTVTYRGQKT